MRACLPVKLACMYSTMYLFMYVFMYPIYRYICVFMHTYIHTIHVSKHVEIDGMCVCIYIYIYLFKGCARCGQREFVHHRAVVPPIPILAPQKPAS